MRTRYESSTLIRTQSCWARVRIHFLPVHILSKHCLRIHLAVLIAAPSLLAPSRTDCNFRNRLALWETTPYRCNASRRELAQRSQTDGGGDCGALQERRLIELEIKQMCCIACTVCTGNLAVAGMRVSDNPEQRCRWGTTRSCFDSGDAAKARMKHSKSSYF